MAWRPAKSLVRLREQVNAAWPNRDKSSDGLVGNAEHSARASDHNPNGAGVVCAIDIDADLSPTENVGVIVNALRASNDKRIKYLIWKGQITEKGDLSRLKKYNGPNGHFHHFHISVSADPKLYDSDAEWAITSKTSGADTATPTPADDRAGIPATDKNADTATLAPDKSIILKRGAKGAMVMAVQKRLKALGYNVTPDGDYGDQTYLAVIKFQTDLNLYVDGRVGPETFRRLAI